MRRIVAYGAVACLAILVTVLVMAPSAWVAAGIDRATQGRVTLADAQGSLWNGSARLMLSPTGVGDLRLPGPDSVAGDNALAPGATLMPYRLQWHTEFWSLFSGHARMTWQESRPLSTPVVLDAGFYGATLSAGSIDLPASLLVGLGAPFNTLDLEGNVHVEWSDWHFIARRGYGHLAVTMRDMSSRVSRVNPLGTYRLLVDAAGDVADVALSTVSGPLSLSGTGRISGTQFQFDGRAQSSPEALPNLAGLLNLMGPVIDERTHALHFRH